MKKKGMWSLRFTSYQLLLLPAAIGINYIGKLLAQTLSLPLWLDSIGIFFACMLGGPVIGALSGLLNNVIFSFLFDPMSLPYGLTSAAMGLTGGALAFRGFVSGWRKVFALGVAVAFVAACVSTPINIVYWDGQNGNLWGDMLFGMATEAGIPMLAASFFAELTVDLPDKIISIYLSYALYKAVPKTIRGLYL